MIINSILFIKNILKLKVTITKLNEYYKVPNATMTEGTHKNALKTSSKFLSAES